jgi:hypothetical protein
MSMELNESGPQSSLFVFQVHFNIFLPFIPVCETATVWNAVFAQYQENWPTAKRSIFVGQSLTIGLLQADYGTVHLLKKNDGSYFLHFSFHFKYHITIRI